MKNVYFAGVWYACYMELYLDDTVKFTMDERSINPYADFDECAWCLWSQVTFDDHLFVRGLNAPYVFEMVPDITKRWISTTEFNLLI